MLCATTNSTADIQLGDTRLQLSDIDTECSILLSATSDGTLPGLPMHWCVPVSTGQLNACTAAMPCGHLFHVSAIVLHLLTNSQRCPLCRRGVDTPLPLASLPKEVRAQYAARLAAMEESDSDNDDDVLRITPHVTVDESVFQRDLNIVLIAWPASHDEPESHLRTLSHWQRSRDEVYAACPTVPMEHMPSVPADEAIAWQPHRLQRWWKRTMFALAERPSPMRVRLRLWHPLMTDMYVTAQLDADILQGTHNITNTSASTLARLDISELDAVLWVNAGILRERIVDAVHAMLTHNNVDVLRALAAP